MVKNTSIQQCTYTVEGMHCASCEILIEKKLLKRNEVEAVDASTARGEVTVQYRGARPSPQELNKQFAHDGYRFILKQETRPRTAPDEFAFTAKGIRSFLVIVGGAALILLVFKLLDLAGLGSWVAVGPDSAVSAFFLYGIVAGLSSCAALVGGIVLSMSKQWYELHAKSSSYLQKAEPHLLFNTGRIASYALLGGVLGLLGSFIQISPVVMAFVAMGVAVLMICLGLQMFGLAAFRRFQFTVPKAFTRYIADESNFTGRFMPATMGALTFFLPCGFTLSAQALAISSGSPVRGALMMAFFALGTAPMLLTIGLSSNKIYEKGGLGGSFMKIVALVVIFFGLMTLNNQFVVMGWPSFILGY